MREIKFKAWNIRRKTMELIYDLYWFEENMCHCNGDSDYILLQYTGLKDMDGEEIYEGDICLYMPSIEAVMMGNCETNCKIYWDQDRCQLMTKSTYFDWQLNSEFPPISLRVIGNIYETPDLLNS